MFGHILTSIDRRKDICFLIAVLLFVNLYSFPTLTTKPAYWYDEAINVELAHNFADFGTLDLIVAPNVFSGAGATVGSTGYPVTVPLAGFFRLFGFGLSEARVYMLLWMSTLLVTFFFVARKLWGAHVAYGGALLLATFAPFYGNGRSVMGEIPGFLFFLLAFYLFEEKRFWLSGIFLGLAVVSKPSVFIFLIPAFVTVLLCGSDRWRRKLIALARLGFCSILALVPWLIIYADEISRGGLAEHIFRHFRNPYHEAGFSALANVSVNLPTLTASTTLLYMWTLLAVVVVALFIERGLFRERRNLFILFATYLPLALLQYLKSFGYLRYLIAAEFLVFVLFLLALPVVLKQVTPLFHSRTRMLPVERKDGQRSGNPVSDAGRKNLTPIFIGVTVLVLISVQTIHLVAFADIYQSEKTQKTILYLYSQYPAATAVGVINVPQIASFIPAFQKYQYLATFGLPDLGTRILYLSPEKLPTIIVTESGTDSLSREEQALLMLQYEKDIAFTEGFSIYVKK